MTELEEARAAINEVDKRMAELFAQRMQAVEKVACYKSAHQLPIFDAAREEAVVHKNEQYITDLKYLPYYEQFIRQTMAVSKEYQKTLLRTLTVGYFGVEGRIRHGAAPPLSLRKGCILFHLCEIFDAVDRGEVTYGILPLKNPTQAMWQHSDLLREHEILLRAYTI